MSVKTDLPNTPALGIKFRPDTTDSVGVVTKILHGAQVTYHYEHAPRVEYTRPWREVQRIAWAA